MATSTSITSGSQSTYLIIVGIFLKLLGFFVVMFTYADFVPDKVTQAETSLKQQFNISINLPDSRTGATINSLAAVQGSGRSYQTLESDLKTQMDFLSAENRARTNQLILQVKAEQVLEINDNRATSPNFVPYLIKTLRKNEPENAVYQLEIIGINGDTNGIMRALGGLVQKMIADGYEADRLTIGYAHDNTNNDAVVEFRIRAVAK